MSSQAPYGYQVPHPHPHPHPHPSIHPSLQPEQVSGYTSLAQWHGGQPPPVFPPRGDPVPPPQPTSNGDHRIPGPPSHGSTRSPTRWLRDGGPTIDPSANQWTCDCGTSFTTPKGREQHWRKSNCGGDGSSEPRPAETFVIPARRTTVNQDQVVDKKWLPVLHKVFRDDANPSKEIRVELAWSMRVPVYAVDNWFISQREAQKEQQKHKYYAYPGPGYA